MAYVVAVAERDDKDDDDDDDIHKQLIRVVFFHAYICTKTYKFKY